LWSQFIPFVFVPTVSNFRKIEGRISRKRGLSTYSEQTFEIPIQKTDQTLPCILKRKESTGQLRCFGSTLKGLDSSEVLEEYRSRWTIENGIKDLCDNYFFDNIPGIDPHKINVHYYLVV
jgi:hypothetical protein